VRNDSDGLIFKLLEKKVILLAGDVTTSMLLRVYESLITFELQGSPDIEIRIAHCDGGPIAQSLDIYDALRRYKGKKTGVVYAYARSMGVIILQACEKRVCLEHACVHIHHIIWPPTPHDVMRNPTRKGELDKDMDNTQDRVSLILKKRTGKSKKEIYYACKKSRDMSAEEALEFGLIDEIERN